MTQAKLRGVLQKYFNEKLDAHANGNVREFSRQTGIKAANVHNASVGKIGVSMGMLCRISETVGPRMDDIFSRISELCSEVHRQEAKHATVRTAAARAAVRSEHAAELATEVAKEISRTGLAHAGGQGEQSKPRHADRPSPHKQKRPH